MRCLECGKNYIQVAVHLANGHKMDPDDYRRKHNIPLTQALCDEGLRVHLSSKALTRMMTDEGIDHIRHLQSSCDRQAQKGEKRDLPDCSKQHCREQNERKSKNLLKHILPVVLADWIKGVSTRDIALKNKMAQQTLRKWVRMGHLPKRKLHYKTVE